MPEYVRVHDEDTGHEYSVIAGSQGPSQTVLDEPAVDVYGEPLPPKHASPKKASRKAAREVPVEPIGQKAATPKEKSDD